MKALRQGRARTVLSVNLCVRWVGCVRNAQATLLPVESPGTHCTGALVGISTCLDGCRRTENSLAS
jgi:hypothetical protein